MDVQQGEGPDLIPVTRRMRELDPLFSLAFGLFNSTVVSLYRVFKKGYSFKRLCCLNEQNDLSQDIRN
jgi:hypothetical protein